MARPRAPRLLAALLAAAAALQALGAVGGLLFAVPAGPPDARGVADQARFVGDRAQKEPASARRVMTITSPMGERMMSEEPPRHWLWGVLLSCFWPWLCFTFLTDANALSAAVQKYPPVVGSALYMAFASFFWVSARTGLFSKSARALVQTICKGLKKLKVRPWKREVFSKVAQPLAMVTEGCLFFLAFNCLANVIPDTAVFNLPRILTFMDVNHDGILGAADVKLWAYGFAGRLLSGWVMLQAALFVHAAKEAPQVYIKEPESMLEKYFQGLQQLHGVNHKSGQHSSRYAQSSRAIMVQCVDKAISLAACACVFFGWAHLANLRLSALLAIGGVGGLAISLSTSNIVQNLMSGALLFANRAVVVGDEIECDAGNGFVDDIRALNTVIYKLDGEPVIVPNSQLVDNAIVNLQRREFWLVEQAFPIAIDDMKKLPEVMQRMQSELESRVAPHQTSQNPGRHHFFQEPIVYLEDFGDCPTVKVRAYVDGDLERHEFYQLKSEILMALSGTVHSFEGVSFTFESGGPPPPMQLLLPKGETFEDAVKKAAKPKAAEE